MKSIRLIALSMTVAAFAGAAVYGCKRAGKSEIPSGVREAVATEIIDNAPDHLVVMAFDVDSAVITGAAARHDGKAEFLTVSDNIDLMMQMGVETTPTVLFIKPGGEIGDRIVGDIDDQTIDEALARQL